MKTKKNNKPNKLMPKLSCSLFFVLILLVISPLFCCLKNQNNHIVFSNIKNSITLSDTFKLKAIVIEKPVTIKNYFKFIDSIVKKYDSLTPYTLNEHLLIRYNTWIIDTLKNTDYYILQARGNFVYRQKDLVVLHKGDSIVFPDLKVAKKILGSFKKTTIDINIPEFKLRIIEDTTMLYEFPIRVGRPEKKFLKMTNRITNLKTKTGRGTVVNHIRNPNYYNPVDGHQYFITKRDDGKVTELPQIPFLETEINGVRSGQNIHPTTNPVTLGKAYSNGCIGTKEADAWVIYYYAPVDTRICIRYDLNVINSNGEKQVLKDVYGYTSKY